ncbi:MAG: metallophosphoesterase family protein [Fusobacteriaceae bacterium]
MKILHCSDIHLGKRPFGNENFSQKRYEDYFKSFGQVVDLAVHEKVQVMIISGDLFDRRDLTPDILARSEEFFRKLHGEGIKVLLTEGNHDNSNRYDEINSWLHYLEGRGLTKRLEYRRDEKGKYSFQKEIIENINFYGLGFPGFGVDRVVEALSQELNGEEKNIVMIHTALGGEGGHLPGLVSSQALNLLKGKALYVAGGHLHSKKIYPSPSRGETPFFFIPGSTEYWNVINERSDEKGVFIFDTEREEYTYHLVEPRKRIKESFLVERKEGVIERFSECIKALNLTGEELLLVELKIKNNIYINSKELEKIAEEEGALKAYILPIFLEENSQEKGEFREESDTTANIERGIIESWEGFGESKLSDHFENLKEIQREGDSSAFERFYQEFDQILEGMIVDEDR